MQKKRENRPGRCQAGAVGPNMAVYTEVSSDLVAIDLVADLPLDIASDTSSPWANRMAL